MSRAWCTTAVALAAAKVLAGPYVRPTASRRAGVSVGRLLWRCAFSVLLEAAGALEPSQSEGLCVCYFVNSSPVDLAGRPLGVDGGSARACPISEPRTLTRVVGSPTAAVMLPRRRAKRVQCL